MTTLNGWTYDIQELDEPFAIFTWHVTGLKFYCERDLEVTQDLKDYVVFAYGGHLVQKLLKCRISPDTHQREVLVQWIGLAGNLQAFCWKESRCYSSDPKAEPLRPFIHTGSSRRREK